MHNAQCLKITTNVAFELWYFPSIFVLWKVTILVTLLDCNLQFFKHSPLFLGFFRHCVVVATSRLFEHLSIWNPNNFYRRNYCMTREAFQILCEELSDAIPHGNSTNGFSLLREERLLIFLWWAKGSAFVEQEAFAMDCSPTVVFRSIDICTKVCV